MLTRSLAVALVLACASDSGAAQADSSAVPRPAAAPALRSRAVDTLPAVRIAAGTRVRVTRTGERPSRVTGALVAADSAGITLARDGGVRLDRFARGDIARFEVPTGRRGRASGAARGLRDGLVVGGLLSGAIIGGFCLRGRGCGSEDLAFGVVLIGGPIMAGSGLLGLAAGMNGSGERWAAVPVPSALSESPSPTVVRDTVAGASAVEGSSSGDGTASAPHRGPLRLRSPPPGFAIQPPIAVPGPREAHRITLVRSITPLDPRPGNSASPRRPDQPTYDEMPVPLAAAASAATASSPRCFPGRSC
jgi:hypothetical protein